MMPAMGRPPRERACPPAVEMRNMRKLPGGPGEIGFKPSEARAFSPFSNLSPPRNQARACYNLTERSSHHERRI